MRGENAMRQCVAPGVYRARNNNYTTRLYAQDAHCTLLCVWALFFF